MASIGTVCLTIWLFLLFSFFNNSEGEPDSLAENDQNSLYEYYGEEFEEAEEDPLEEVNLDKDLDIQREATKEVNQLNPSDEFVEKSRGNGEIYPGDFDHIAPDGTISIDIILEELLEVND